MKRFHRFSTKLILSMLTIGLIPLLVVTGLTFTKINQTMTHSVYDKNDIAVKGVRATVDEKMASLEETMKFLAHLDSVEAMDPKVFEEYLLNTVEENAIISQIYVMDPSGMQIYKTSGELGDRSDRAYFISAMEGEGNYSDVLTSGSTGLPIIVRAEPIIKGDKTVGVIGASIDLDFLSKLITDLTVDGDSYGFIVDEKGILLAHPDMDLVLNKEDLSYLEPVQHVLEKQSSYDNYSYDGQKKIASYAYLDRTNWGIVVQTTEEDAYGDLRALLTMALGITILVVIVIIITSLILARNINKPIKAIEAHIKQAKNGDLNISFNQRITSRKDEFGLLAKDFQEMIEVVSNLLWESKKLTMEVVEIAADLALMSEQTKDLSDEITITVEDIAKGANDQAEESEKSVQLAYNFNGKFEELMKRSQDMHEMTKQVVRVNNNNQGKMIELEESTSTNLNATQKVESSIKDLSIKSQNIAGIVETITSISEQTNLLALNASIEAARAGEHGRGFSVVATEIRKLAEESGEASSKINLIISSIQADIEEAVSNMVEVSQSTSRQVDSVQEVDQSVMEIGQSVENIAQHIDKVVSSIEVLSNDNHQVVDAITNISSVSEETAAATEEVTAAVTQQLNSVERVMNQSKDLKVLSQQLSVEIEKFHIAERS